MIVKYAFVVILEFLAGMLLLYWAFVYHSYLEKGDILGLLVIFTAVFGFVFIHRSIHDLEEYRKYAMS